ncbi:elongation of very long chain fatty acids protein [Nesidiocoris tenuis]|uniref:Elongation of very long chain fatty acids protein n=1 Tax=Nesidiocoris tenuis TaxID=355587 RepID=A0ABN7BDQ0_9HEMI|nr:elongation of very long chain fatty acids protein [Nesidiocoris tenuis]
MAESEKSWLEKFYDLMEKYEDPRSRGYPLMSSPFPTLAIIATYIFIVKYLGPKLMENRPAFRLKRLLVYYNILNVIISLIAIEEAYAIGWFTHYSMRCQPVEYGDTPILRRLVTGVWLYYITKFVELLDTIFFVLRKKNDQISKLHVYHHSIMPINAWLSAKFLPGGNSIFCGVINSFVHVIMYSYYLMSAMGPGMRKYLWWKKYLTVLQMGQFVLIFLHMMQVFFIKDCTFPRPFAYFILVQATIFLILFKNFYDNSYKTSQKSTANDSTMNNGISEKSANGLSSHQDEIELRRRTTVSGKESSS